MSSQLNHWERRQGMPREPSGGQFDEAPVKTCAGPCRNRGSDKRTREAEPSEAARDIDPVGAPKRFDKPIRMGPCAGDLVMIRDHRLDLGDPLRSRVGRKVLARE